MHTELRIKDNEINGVYARASESTLKEYVRLHSLREKSSVLLLNSQKVESGESWFRLRANLGKHEKIKLTIVASFFGLRARNLRTH